MNDNYWIFPATAVAFIILFGLAMLGAKIENNRIYDKCLTMNSSMVYIDVVKLCREIVK